MTESMDIAGAVETPSTGFAVTPTQRNMLIALGGLVVFTGILAAIASRSRRATAPPLILGEPGSAVEWETSLRHFAGAVDSRFAGIQQQLDAINRHLPDLRSEMGTLVTTTVPSVLGGLNGDGPANQVAPSGEPMGDAPGPAAVSM